MEKELDTMEKFLGTRKLEEKAIVMTQSKWLSYYLFSFSFSFSFLLIRKLGND